MTHLVNKHVTYTHTGQYLKNASGQDNGRDAILACMCISLEQWRASIDLFNSKCQLKQRVKVNVSMAFFYFLRNEFQFLE